MTGRSSSPPGPVASTATGDGSDRVSSDLPSLAGPLSTWERLAQAAPLFFILWGLALGVSFLRVPIPGVNEPHYLTKAKAFWDHSWCAGDLFLQSASPHQAFYLLFGWMTRLLTLGQTAVVCRIASLALVAWGWLRLTRALGCSPARSIISFTTLMLLQALGAWSGEWLVGGVESKVLAYGLAFAGLGAFVGHRTTAAGVWLGLATTLHPLIGGWSLTAAALAEFLPRSSGMPADPTRIRRVFVTGLVWFVFAAPGIAWAIPSLRADSAHQAQTADFLQVTYRLSHHLDPWTFPRESHRYFASLVAILLLLRQIATPHDRERRFDRIAFVSLGIALVACALSWGPRPWPRDIGVWEGLQLKLLKFYPFRMADMLIPVAVAIGASRLWDNCRGQWPRRCWLIAGLTYAGALGISNLDQNPSRMSTEKRRDWLAALDWIRQNTPSDALLHAANEEWAVKWYAARPEFANFKDCPQDPASIVEWNRRLLQFARWAQASFADDRTYATAELAELHRQTGIQYLVVSRLGPFTDEPVYSNTTFRIYQLPREPLHGLDDAP